MRFSNLLSRIRGENKTVGLDIGHRLIKMAVVSHRQNTKTLLSLESDTIPEGVVIDNEVRNIQVLADKIQAMLIRAMPNGTAADFAISVNWNLGILCDRILVKHVPKVPESELILQTAMSRSPFDDIGNVLDYSVLERREDGIEAMIVAAKKDSLSSWLNLFEALNIKLSAIDVDIFVLNNICNLIGAQDDFLYDEDNSILLINLGYSKSYVAILRGGNFSSARSLQGTSIKELQEQISVPLGVSPERCGELLMGKKPKDLNIDESRIKSTMDFLLEEISMKVDTALRYFSSSDNYRNPSKVVLVGGGSNIEGLSNFIADRLSLDLMQLDLFKILNINKNDFAGINWNVVPNLYSIALGLALRKF